MEQRRSWFSRFRPRLKSFLVKQKQKNRSESTSSREAAASSKGVPPQALADDLASSITRQKVAAAKQYIENHYKSQMKNLQERKERYAKRSLSLSLLFRYSLLDYRFRQGKLCNEEVQETRFYQLWTATFE